MTAHSRIHGWSTFLAVMAVVFVLGGCSEEKERTRQDDNIVLRKMVAEFETWVSQRDAGAFTRRITESFDAGAFIDTLWAGVEADRVVFNVRRLRTSEDKSRAVIDAAFMTGETMVAGKFVVVEMIFAANKWKANSYQLFGPGN